MFLLRKYFCLFVIYPPFAIYKLDVLCMDRKQQNVSTCRTDSNGLAIYGCHGCEAKGISMIDTESTIPWFSLCSPQAYVLSRAKVNSVSEHSTARGYNTMDYNAMKFDDISNNHFASCVDMYHAFTNLMEMLDKCLKNNILSTAGHIDNYNKYLSFLTKERDSHNCIDYNGADISADTKFIKSIKLDQCFNISVKCLCYIILIYTEVIVNKSLNY